MSSAARKIQNRKADKAGHKRKKGPATSERMVAKLNIPVPDIPPEDIDLTKANPACKDCHGTGYGRTIVKGDHREKLICLCVSRAYAGTAPWLKRGYHGTVYAAATELAAGRITKTQFEEICKRTWVKHKGPVPAGQMLCVELRGEEIVIGHQPIPKGLDVEAGVDEEALKVEEEEKWAVDENLAEVKA